jgi:hypothetical protein
VRLLGNLKRIWADRAISSARSAAATASCCSSPTSPRNCATAPRCTRRCPARGAAADLDRLLGLLPAIRMRSACVQSAMRCARSGASALATG